MVTILEEAQRLVDGDRNEDYGHPTENIEYVAIRWSLYLSTRFKTNVRLTGRDVGMMMVDMKVQRDAETPKRDNVVDAAGYLYIGDVCTQARADAEKKGIRYPSYVDWAMHYEPMAGGVDLPESLVASPQPDMSDDKKPCPKVGDVVHINGLPKQLIDRLTDSDLFWMVADVEKAGLGNQQMASYLDGKWLLD